MRDVRLTAVFGTGSSEERRERMKKRLTRKPHEDTSVHILGTSANGNKMVVSQITDAGWADMYIGEIEYDGDGAYDTLRHVALNGFMVQTFIRAYQKRIGIMPIVPQDFVEKWVTVLEGERGPCIVDRAAEIEIWADSLCQECGAVLKNTDDGVCATCSELILKAEAERTAETGSDGRPLFEIQEIRMCSCGRNFFPGPTDSLICPECYRDDVKLLSDGGLVNNH